MDTRKLDYQKGTGDQHHLYFEEGGGRTVALTYNDTDMTLAPELVRRWNAHPELVEALEAIEDLPVNDEGERTIPAGFLDNARAILKSLEQ